MKKIFLKFLKKNVFIYDLFLFLYISPTTFYYSFFLIIFSIFKIDSRKIIIINYSWKWYWDMWKYIANSIIKSNYKIYWATKELYKSSLPNWIRYIKYNSISYLYHLATAKIWINNSRFWYGIRKRAWQFYIQTWHGCFTFKKIEAAAESALPKYYIWGAKNDSKMANLFVSNSDFCTNLYKSYFWYSGKILEFWCPRNDIIVNKNTGSLKNVRNCYNLINWEKLCLYAPTFRVDNSLNAYNMDYNLLLKELENKFKWRWKLLIRLHPNISHKAKELNYFNKNIINVTDYPDMQELLVASDFLITDYSSCIFDYSLSRKPSLIYASDISNYKKDRNFEIRLEDTPFPIALNNNELKNIIKDYDITKFRKKLDNFYINMWLKETGKSCDKIAKIIADIIW